MDERGRFEIQICESSHLDCWVRRGHTVLNKPDDSSHKYEFCSSLSFIHPVFPDSLYSLAFVKGDGRFYLVKSSPLYVEQIKIKLYEVIKVNKLSLVETASGLSTTQPQYETTHWIFSSSLRSCFLASCFSLSGHRDILCEQEVPS